VESRLKEKRKRKRRGLCCRGHPAVDLRKNNEEEGQMSPKSASYKSDRIRQNKRN
jgi:hypothetical protein